MWLHDRPPTTVDSYRRNVQQMLDFVQKPLPQIVLEDLQAYSSYLQEQGIKESSRKTKLNAIKSLFTFATKLNYCRFNVAAALRVPKQNKSVADKIIGGDRIYLLIDNAKPGRDRNLLRLIYATGIRVSEACNLRWQDFRERDDGSVQVTVLGKGNKIRSVIVPENTWQDLKAGLGRPEYYVFGKKIKPLHRTTAHRIIKKSAIAARINPKVSIHWLRHSHCTHALGNGAPIALVRDSMGHSSIAITDIYTHSNPVDSSSNYLSV